MHRFIRCLTLVALLAAPDWASAQYEPAGCVNAEELELADLINQYRGENGLAAIPLSTALTAVAQWHLADMRHAIEVTGDYGSDPSCNLHTWYGIPDAPYGTCCYTSDHAQAACMWSKPSEISGGSYNSTGYEIAAYGYGSPSGALQGWKQSSGHNAVILNEGIWTDQTWRAMGIGVAGGFYFVWFATATDPQGAPASCSSTNVPSHREPFATLDVRPNPFNPRTTIEIELDRAARVEVAVLDTRGRVVRRFDAVSMSQGLNSLVWNGEDEAGAPAPSGVYFVRVIADGRTMTRKAALVR